MTAAGLTVLFLTGCSTTQPEPTAPTQPTAQPVPQPTTPVGPQVSSAPPGDPNGPGPAPDPNNMPADTVTLTKKQVVANTTGKPLDEATRIAHQGGYTVRLIQVDGQDMPATMDYSETRVNFKVNGGQVTEASVG